MPGNNLPRITTIDFAPLAFQRIETPTLELKEFASTEFFLGSNNGYGTPAAQSTSGPIRPVKRPSVQSKTGIGSNFIKKKGFKVEAIDYFNS